MCVSVLSWLVCASVIPGSLCVWVLPWSVCVCVWVCECVSVSVCVCVYIFPGNALMAPLTDNIIMPIFSTLAILNDENLQTKHARASLLQRRISQNAQRWSSLKLQGELAALPYTDHSVSHSIITHYSTPEDILIFKVKAWLQCQTKYNLAIWYPSKHNQYCIFHLNQQ